MIKKFNTYILPLSLLVLTTAVLVLSSCGVDHALDPDEYAKIYMPQARTTTSDHTVITGIDTLQNIIYGASYGGPSKPTDDISVSFSINPAMVDSFNNVNVTSYPILPNEAYQLGEESSTIPAGETHTPELKLTINGNVGIEDQKYLLPITMKVTSGEFPVNEDLQTAYFLISTHKVQKLNTDVIITGFLVNAPGSDVPQKGDSRHYDDTGATFSFEGGLEYVQFMALRDIDFSKTPYSVVVGRHYHDHIEGWASGEDMSFKFNLTDGTAAKGTFFYISEGSKVINGYNHDGLSTDISDANWIRTLQVNLGDDSIVAGDDFGNSTSGLLTNSSDATGIAVFEGTNVTASSVPIDAVFYGSNIDGALKGNYGYRIPEKSDLYSAVNEDTGEDQALFGQGSNDFMAAGAKTTANFIQMGGVFTKDIIIKPRTNPTILELKHNSGLSDIEGGAATIFQ